MHIQIFLQLICLCKRIPVSTFVKPMVVFPSPFPFFAKRTHHLLYFHYYPSYLSLFVHHCLHVHVVWFKNRREKYPMVKHHFFHWHCHWGLSNFHSLPLWSFIIHCWSSSVANSAIKQYLMKWKICTTIKSSETICIHIKAYIYIYIYIHTHIYIYILYLIYETTIFTDDS